MSDLHTDMLADLYAKRRDIDKAIKSLEAIRSWTAPEEPRQKSLMEAVAGVLRKRECVMSPAEIVIALEESGFEIGGLDKHRNVGATLNRGKNAGTFYNPERGQWGLAEWENVSDDDREQPPIPDPDPLF